MARRLGDDAALGLALIDRHIAANDPAHLDERPSGSAEIIAVARRLEDPESDSPPRRSRSAGRQAIPTPS